jgi:hypothetical protein
MEQQIFKILGELKEDVGELKAETKGINSRLDRLNGSVARHEKDILEIKLDRAKESGEEKGEERVKKSFWDKAWEIGKVPILLFIGAICSPVVQKLSILIAKLLNLIKQ